MTKKYSLDKDKIRVLLLEGIHESAVKDFKDAGYINVEYIKTALDAEELEQKIKNVHIIGIRSRTQLTQKILKKLKNSLPLDVTALAQTRLIYLLLNSWESRFLMRHFRIHVRLPSL